MAKNAIKLGQIHFHVVCSEQGGFLWAVCCRPHYLT